MATDANNDQANTNEKVTFTPEQQTRINEIVNDAIARTGREAREEVDRKASRVRELEQEVAAAKQEAVRAKTSGERKEANDDVAALQAQIAEIKAAGQGTQTELEKLRKLNLDKDAEIAKSRGDAVNIRKEIAIRDAASKANIIDIEMATESTGKHIIFDEQRQKFVVVGENGQPRLNAAYDPMSLDEFYTEFAAKKPYMVRSDIKGGAGSSESQRSGLSNNGKYTIEQIFGSKSNGALANKLALADKKEYNRLRVIAKESGLI